MTFSHILSMSVQVFNVDAVNCISILFFVLCSPEEDSRCRVETSAVSFCNKTLFTVH